MTAKWELAYLANSADSAVRASQQMLEITTTRRGTCGMETSELMTSHHSLDQSVHPMMDHRGVVEQS